MKFRWYLLFVVLLLAVVATTIVLWPKQEAVSIVAIVQKKDLHIKVKATGDLQASKAITISSPLDGRSEIKSLVAEGTLVKKGDIVVEFDDHKLSHEVKKLKLELTSKEKELEQAIAEQESEREKMLLELKQFKTDAAIAGLELQDLQNQPRPNDLEIAKMEFRQAQIVKKTAEKEYKRIREDGKKFAKSEEIRKLEMDLQRAISKHLQADLKLRLTSSGASRYVLKKLKMQQKKMLLKVMEIKKAIPDKIKQLQSKLERAKTKIEAVKNRLEKAREKLEQSKVKANSAGMIIYRKIWGRKISVGRSYWSGAPLIDMPDLSIMQLKSKVRESQISLVKIGQKTTIYIDGIPGRSFVGEVAKIGKIAMDSNERDVVGWLDRNKKKSTGVKIFEVIIKVKESSSLILPNMTAKAFIHVDKLKDVCVVPKISVTKTKEGSFIFVKEQGKIEKRKVKVGIENGYEVVISEGVKEGEQVLLGKEQSA